MGNILAKQPNGLYCIWNTSVDGFIIHNATLQEIVSYYVEDAIKNAKENILQTLLLPLYADNYKRIDNEVKFNLLPENENISSEAKREILKIVEEINNPHNRKIDFTPKDLLNELLSKYPYLKWYEELLK